MSLLTEITRMKSMMGITESNIERGLQRMINNVLQRLQNSTEEMGLGEMDELDEINSIDEIKVTNFVKDKTPVLYVDLYVNSNRKDFDNIIATMEYEVEKHMGDIQIIVDKIIDTRTFGPGIDW